MRVFEYICVGVRVCGSSEYLVSVFLNAVVVFVPRYMRPRPQTCRSGGRGLKFTHLHTRHATSAPHMSYGFHSDFTRLRSYYYSYYHFHSVFTDFTPYDTRFSSS